MSFVGSVMSFLHFTIMLFFHSFSVPDFFPIKMFYNHELLKRNGRFGVLWLAATKPRVLSESEIRHCDLKTLCKEIQEHFNHRVGQNPGKPLFRYLMDANLVPFGAFRNLLILQFLIVTFPFKSVKHFFSLRTCTTLFLGATDVYIKQTKLLARDCRRFREKVRRVLLGYDSDGNPIAAVTDAEEVVAPAEEGAMGPPPPPRDQDDLANDGRKTPRRGKGAKAAREDGEEEEDEEGDDGRAKGTKRKKGKKDDDGDDDAPKKKRKVTSPLHYAGLALSTLIVLIFQGKTTITAPEAENHLAGWDMLFYDNLLQGIPEPDESEFFYPNSQNTVDSSRITMRELNPKGPGKYSEA